MMKKLVRYSLLFFLLAAAFAGVSRAGEINKLTAAAGPSFLKYKIVHPLHEFESVSKEVTCTIGMDDSSRTIRSAFFSADVTSFDSGNSNRDSHAMETLDALTFPSVSFQSSTLQTAGCDLRVTGDLTFHGQTHPVTFSATSTATGDTLAVAGSAAISMTAFGIDRPSLLLVPVQDTIWISFQMMFPKGIK